MNDQDSKTSIVLVHGAFADGSSWNKVIPLLEREGFQRFERLSREAFGFQQRNDFIPTGTVSECSVHQYD